MRFNFAGGLEDGSEPSRSLINVNGMLYGTTFLGGENGKHGTVFAITTAGSERVLHSFGSGEDGSEPLSGLTVLNGQLYGTTTVGGSLKKGTIYVITPSGSETVVHSFSGGSGGNFSDANLIAVSGTLYGTTMWSSGHQGGIVFQYSP